MKRLFTLYLCMLTLFTHAQHQCKYTRQGTFNKTGNITPGDEALMNRYDVHYYKLDLDLQNSSLLIKGNAAMHARVITAMSEVILQLHSAMLIDSVLLNDSHTTYSRTTDILAVQAPGMLQPNDLFRLAIYYHGQAPQAGAAAIGNGVNVSSPQKATWSLSQPFSAYEWWPCKQILTDKADSSDFFITTDSVNKAGSNGLLKNKVILAGGKVRYEWKSSYPIAYYLISFAVCPYEEYNLYAHPAGSDSILIQNYVYKNADPEVKQSIDWTPAFIEHFSTLFGLYPFAAEKYGHCQSGTGGGMEHQTMTTLGEFSFGVVAHELGHQWFGDFVTCGSWSDIWLNEGFASYCEYLALEKFMPGAQTGWLNDAMQAAKDAPGAVYVTDSFNTGAIFDFRSSYKKGAMLLHMLRYEFNNDSLFFAGIRSYLQVHQYSTAKAPGFKSIMAQVLGRNLDTFFDQWYYNPGYPVFSGRWNQVGNKVLFSLKQTPTLGSTVFKTSLQLKYSYSGGDTMVRIRVDSAAQFLELNTAGKTITSIRLDPENNILNDVLSIAKDPLYMSVDLSNPDGSGVWIYPNPATDFITLVNAAGSVAQVFDLKGVAVRRMFIDQHAERLNVDDLAPGLYVIRLTSDHGVSNLKFSKQ